MAKIENNLSPAFLDPVPLQTVRHTNSQREDVTLTIL